LLFLLLPIKGEAPLRNDFVKVVKISIQLKEVLNTIIKGPIKQIDLGKVGDGNSLGGK